MRNQADRQRHIDAVVRSLIAPLVLAGRDVFGVSPFLSMLSLPHTPFCHDRPLFNRQTSAGVKKRAQVFRKPLRRSDLNHTPPARAIPEIRLLSRFQDTVTDTVRLFSDPQKRGGEGGVIRVFLLATLFFRWNSGTVEQNRCSPRLARVSAVPPFWRFCSTNKFVEQRPSMKNPARGRVGGVV